jgi:DNA modification methylase
MTPYYSDDLVTIYHGDSREWMPDVDSVITDPPYGAAMSYGEGSSDAPDEHAAWLASIVPILERAAPVRLITPGIRNVWYWPPADWIVCWYKPGASGRADLPQPLRPQGAFNEWEPVLVYGKARVMQDVIREPAIPQRDTGGHPCPKPLGLMRRLVQATSGTVLDPFTGSGTTLVAAKSLGRKAIGIEIEERYCEIAARRCSQEVLGLVA